METGAINTRVQQDTVKLFVMKRAKFLTQMYIQAGFERNVYIE